MLVNQYGCQVWDCHEEATPDQPTNSAVDPTNNASSGVGPTNNATSEVDLGAAFGFGCLGFFVLMLLVIGMCFLLKFLKGRVSCFMHEQTHFRSIQWRINRARAREMRTQLRDFFDRSKARMKRSKLEESIYSDISKPAKKSTPSLLTRVTSGIRSPIASWKKACRETPTTEQKTPKKKENIAMKRRNLANEYTASPTTQPSSVVSPQLPPRNNPSAKANLRPSDDCLINLNNIEVVSTSYETIGGDATDEMTHWSSALGSPESGNPAVVRVGFNTNDQDATGLQSNASNSAGRGAGNNVVSDDNNSLSPSLYKDLAACKIEIDANLAQAEEDLKEEFQTDNHESDPAYGPISLLRGVANGLFSIFRSNRNPAADLSNDSMCEFLQNRLDQEGQRSSAQTTGNLFSTNPSSFGSPGVPMAQSTPMVKAGSKSSIQSDASSDAEVDETIRATVSPTKTKAQGKVLVQNSTSAPLTAANVSDVDSLGKMVDSLSNIFVNIRVNENVNENVSIGVDESNDEGPHVYANTVVYGNVTHPSRVAPPPPRQFLLSPPNLVLSPPAVNLPPPAVNLPPPAVNLPPPAVNLPPPAVNLPPPAVELPPPAVDDFLPAPVDADQQEAEDNHLPVGIDQQEAVGDDQQEAVGVDQQEAVGVDQQEPVVFYLPPAPVDAIVDGDQQEAEDDPLQVSVGVDQQEAVGVDQQEPVVNDPLAAPVDVDQQEAVDDPLQAAVEGDQQEDEDNHVDLDQHDHLPPDVDQQGASQPKRKYQKKVYTQTSNYNLRSKKNDK
jgi:hypothetical protein